MTTSTYRAVLFDVDDTLLPHRERVAAAVDRTCADLAAVHQVPAPAIAATYRRLSRAQWAVPQVARPELLSLVRRRLWAETVETCGIALSPLQLDHLVADFSAMQLDAVQPDPLLVELLAEVHRRARIGIVTNGEGTTQAAKLWRLGASRYVDAMVCGMDTGRCKPDPDPFRRACEELQREPAECVYVGDNWTHDVLGATAAGLRPVWITHGSPLPATSPAAISYFRTIYDCLRALSGWSLTTSPADASCSTTP